MIAVQESFGQIIIPYGISLSTRIFDILNELGILFIPFGVMIFFVTAKARSQGLDEGSPAVLAIKMYEQVFYSMFVVLVIFVIPWKNAEVTTSYKTYTCGYNGEKSAFNALYNQQPKITSAANNIQKHQPLISLGLGLTNNLAVGSAEILSATLPCNNYFEVMEGKLQESYIDIKDENLISNLKHFSQQCYQKGLHRISDGITNETSTLTSTANPNSVYDRENNYFYGYNLNRAYQGASSSPNLSPLTLQIKDSEYVPTIKDSYKPDNYDPSVWAILPGRTNRLAINCEDAAFDYYAELQTYVKNNLDDEIEKTTQTQSQFPVANSSGSPKYITEADVENAYIQQAFLDAVIGKRSLIQQTPNVKQSSWYDDIVSIWLDDAEDAVTKTYNSNEGSGTKIFTETMLSVGLALEMHDNAAKRLSMYAFIPIVASILLTIVYLASPILIVMSGYSWNMVYNQCFMIFYLAMSTYILNISALLSNTFTLISESFYGDSSVRLMGDDVMDFMSFFIPIATFGAWTAICVIAGLKLGPFILTFMSTTAAAAGKQGADTAKGTAKAIASKATGGLSRVATK